MNKLIFLILGFIILLTGCAQVIKEDKINEDLEFRINVLYGHTLVMEQYSSKDELQKLGLNVSVLDNQSILTPIQKIDILEKSYNIKKSGTYENRVEKLEKKMNQIMENYYS